MARRTVFLGQGQVVWSLNDGVSVESRAFGLAIHACQGPNAPMLYSPSSPEHLTDDRVRHNLISHRWAGFEGEPMATGEAQKELEVRITELQDVVKSLTETVNRIEKNYPICYECGGCGPCFECGGCSVCRPICRPSCYPCIPCRPVCYECGPGGGPCAPAQPA
jgi:hypothetical protein